LFKVTFNIPYGTSLAGNSPHGLCVPMPGGSCPKMGETWIVEATRRTNTLSQHVKLIRRWRGVLSDYELIQKGQPDFRKGVLVFRDGASFPLKETTFAKEWNDYRFLSANTNTVIIRSGKAIRWKKKGKPPEEMPLHRFATKYKNQRLSGSREEIEYFLNSHGQLVAQAVEESKNKRMVMCLEGGTAAEEGGATASTI